MQKPLPLDNRCVVGVTKIGRGNASYWIEAVAEGGEDYYTKPGEAPGEWIGELAAELGLHGEVDRDDYAAVLAGRHPGTGEVLVRRPEPRVFTDAEGRERRHEPILGYDVRFAAPKSVSLLYAIGSPEVRAAALRAHDHAVAEGLAYLHRNACFVQRGAGGKRIEPGAGFVAMAFRHRSSRAGDPALHTHVVTANMTRAVSDGRWLSLAAPERTHALLAAREVGRPRLPGRPPRRPHPRARSGVGAGPKRLCRHQGSRPAGDRALLPTAGGDRRSAGRARRQLTGGGRSRRLPHSRGEGLWGRRRESARRLALARRGVRADGGVDRTAPPLRRSSQATDDRVAPTCERAIDDLEALSLPLRSPRPALRAREPADRRRQRLCPGRSGRDDARRRAGHRGPSSPRTARLQLLHDPAPVGAGAGLRQDRAGWKGRGRGHRRQPDPRRRAGAPPIPERRAGGDGAPPPDRRRADRRGGGAAGRGQDDRARRCPRGLGPGRLSGARRRHRAQRLGRAERRRGAGHLDRRASDARRAASRKRAAAALPRHRDRDGRVLDHLDPARRRARRAGGGLRRKARLHRRSASDRSSGPGRPLRAPDQRDRAERAHRNTPPARSARPAHRRTRPRRPGLRRPRPARLPRATGYRRHDDRDPRRTGASTGTSASSGGRTP